MAMGVYLPDGLERQLRPIDYIGDLVGSKGLSQSRKSGRAANVW